MWALGAIGRGELRRRAWGAGPRRALSSSAGRGDRADGSHSSFLQNLLDEIRIARAGKASADYRRRRDAAATTASGASSQVAGSDADATPTPGDRTAAPPDPDLLLHPSRARADLNAYARGPMATSAASTSPNAVATHTPAPGSLPRAWGASGQSPPAPPPPSPPPLRWQDDDDVEDLSGWRPVTYGESGIEAMVERRIRDSVARGELDNLKGRGQPLEALGPKHDAQFYKVDPLMAALSRSMGAQAIKPRSLELRDELAEARQEFEQAVAAEAVRRRQQRSQGARFGGQGLGAPCAAGSGSGATSSDDGGGRSSSSSSSRSSSSSSSRREEEARQVAEELAAADLPGLAHRFEQVCLLRSQYNGAVLADKETYGAGWPLEQLRRLEYGQEVARLAAAALLREGA